MKNDLTHLLPDQKKLEERFSFIKDTVLHANVAIAFRHIIFLINLQTHSTLPGPILYSLHKDIIVHTATIVESCVHYILRFGIDNNLIDESSAMDYEWVEEANKLIHEFEDGNKRVCGVIQRKQVQRLSKHTHFMQLNRACKRVGIFDDASFEAAEKLRLSRNRIHLAGLNEVDEFYTKEDVDRHFEYTNTVLNRIELTLSRL